MSIKFLNGIDVDNGVLYTDTTNNRVGVGTASPGAKLDVASGDIRLATNSTYFRVRDTAGAQPRVLGMNATNTTYIGPIDSYVGGAVVYGVSTNVAYHGFYGGGSEKVRITSGGNVGIGTTNPLQKLHVSSGDQSSARIRLSNTNTASGGDNIELVAGVHNVTQDGFSIYNASGGATQFVIQGGGNVGIGTTSPTEKLDVAGAIKMSASALYPLTIGHDSSTSRSQITSTNGGLDIISGYNNTIVFKDATTTNMSINGYDGNVIMGYNSGKVGIGTSSPAFKLDVAGSTRIVGNLQLYQGSTSNQYLNISQAFSSTFINTGTSGETIFFGAPAVHQSNIQVQGNIIAQGGSSNTSFQTKDNTSTVTNYIPATGDVYFNGGDVGIGTTSPGEKLEVNGHVKAVDGYKGYVSHFHSGGFFHSPRSQDGANPVWISTNTTAMASSDQYYNHWVPLYAGRIRKIILKHTSGSTPTATACTFRKKINGVLSGTTYTGSVTGGAGVGMKVTFDFGTTNFTFNAEDEVQIGVVTGVATQPRMGGISYQIWYEYNIT